jgi:hypothetical protein
VTRHCQGDGKQEAERLRSLIGSDMGLFGNQKSYREPSRLEMEYLGTGREGQLVLSGYSDSWPGGFRDRSPWHGQGWTT